MAMKRRAGGFPPLRRTAGRRKLGEYIRTLSLDMRKNGLPKVLGAFAAILAADAVIVFLVERAAGNGAFGDLWDGLWWSFVTNITVGYGDKVPASPGGRGIAMGFMLASFAASALASGTIASLFVERRIREGKGLLNVSARGHALLLGWNRNAETVLGSFKASGGKGAKSVIVLVNGSEGDWFDGLKSRFPSLELRFVRGDFANEAVLRRADASRAKAAIIIPDESGGASQANADDRTVLAALALRSMNPGAAISAEVMKPESEGHLRRAGVDGIVLSGEFSGYLLSSSGSSRGVPEAARRLLTPAATGPLRNEAMPRELVGRTFLEASDWFIRNGRGVLLGVLSGERGVSLQDLVSDDSSAIDDFIKRKFREASIPMDDPAAESGDVRLAPGPAYLIRAEDEAFVVGGGAR